MAELALGDRYERWIASLVKSGRYSTASEVVRDSLRLLEQHERERDAKLQHLQTAIADGDASGEAQPLDIVDIKREARLAKAQRSS